jgi:MoxR-like ATPase
MVVLTSNNYRDMSDALKRRCIHLYIDYPEPELEKRIICLKLPDIDEILADRIISAINRIRGLDLKKRPCISETLNWAQSLMVLNIESLSKQAVSDTLNVICKHRVDAQLVRNSMDQVLSDD